MHPRLAPLFEQARNQPRGQYVTWEELIPLIETIGELMSAEDSTQAAETQVEQDVAAEASAQQARDDAQAAALTDLTAEVSLLKEKVEAGTPVTDTAELKELETRLVALHTTITGQTADEVAETTGLTAADPGTQTPVDPTPPANEPEDPTKEQARAVYTHDTTVETVDAAQWPTPVPPTQTEAGVPVYYFAGDVNPGDELGTAIAGWTLYTGVQEPVPAAS
jgi:hypothetical protein